MSKKKLPIQKRSIELRNLQSSGNSDDMKVGGVAVVFEKPTTICEIDGIEYKEVIDRKAFDNSDFSLCCLKYNHAESVPLLARTRNKSLDINIDNDGLAFEAKLANTSIARDIYTLIQENLLTQCSFAFTVKSYDYDKVTHTRRILEIDKVFDISIVDIPAYEDTEVEARSFFKLENEKETPEGDILKRKRLLLMLG